MGFLHNHGDERFRENVDQILAEEFIMERARKLPDEEAAVIFGGVIIGSTMTDPSDADQVLGYVLDIQPPVP